MFFINNNFPPISLRAILTLLIALPMSVQAVSNCGNQDVLNSFSEAALDLKLIDGTKETKDAFKEVLEDFGTENIETVKTLVKHGVKKVPDNFDQIDGIIQAATGDEKNSKNEALQKVVLDAVVENSNIKKEDATGSIIAATGNKDFTGDTETAVEKVEETEEEEEVVEETEKETEVVTETASFEPPLILVKESSPAS